MARFSEEFPVPLPRPSFKDWDIVAPPITSRPGGAGVVGTAFDYLFRFHLRRLHPATQDDGWVAVNSLLYLEGELAKEAKEILDVASVRHQKFLASETLDDELLESAALLAQLDAIFRSGGMLPASGKFIVDADDIEDLRQLLKVCPWDQWRNGSNVKLNPSFGNSCILVGGADGDFWIDEALYEIKTARDFKKLTFHHHQLVGYSALNFLSCGETMKEISIYFARFAKTLTYTAPNWEDARYVPFLCWFCHTSTARFGGSIILESLLDAIPNNLALHPPLSALTKELSVRDGWGNFVR